MKNVQLIRGHVVQYLHRLRGYVSTLPDGRDTLDRLRGDEGEKRAARIIGFIMQELGHDSEKFNHRGDASPVETAASNVRRALTRVRGAREEST